MENHAVEGVKRKRIAKYIDFGSFEGYISKTVQDNEESSFQWYHVWRYSQGINQNEDVKVKLPPPCCYEITWKRCKIGSKLELIGSRIYGFRLLPKSVTLNDLEKRNGRVVCVISANSLDFGAYFNT